MRSGIAPAWCGRVPRTTRPDRSPRSRSWPNCSSGPGPRVPCFLSDECYVDVYEGDPPGSVLQVAGADLAGTLAFYSCSKRSGMTGYRSGAIVGDAEAIAALVALRSSAGVAPAEFVQAAAVAAWSDDEHAAERRDIFAAKRAVLRRAFDAAGTAGRCLYAPPSICGWRSTTTSPSPAACSSGASWSRPGGRSDRAERGIFALPWFRPSKNASTQWRFWWSVSAHDRS